MPNTDKQEASDLIELCQEISRRLEDMGRISHEIGDAALRAELRRGIGEVTALVVSGLEMKIYEKFPELDPLGNRQP